MLILNYLMLLLGIYCKSATRCYCWYCYSSWMADDRTDDATVGPGNLFHHLSGRLHAFPAMGLHMKSLAIRIRCRVIYL